MSSHNTVIVKNIASATADKEVEDFFSFCGKITDIKVVSEADAKTATVTFEKDTAAKTALLLNNTQLGANHISVTGTANPEDPSPATPPAAAAAAGLPTAGASASSIEHKDADELTQEEKPRARVFAEYLAHGYVIGDAALERAIDLDHRHNVSSRFASKLQQLDSKYHASDRAKVADKSYGITTRASSLFNGLSSYFEKATNTPTGKRVVDFYTAKQRQVQDIHNEARRLAEIKKEEHGGSAVKASGLEKLFGHSKPAAASATAPGAESSIATTSVTGALTPSDEPKFDPPPTAPKA